MSNTAASQYVQYDADPRYEDIGSTYVGGRMPPPDDPFKGDTFKRTYHWFDQKTVTHRVKPVMRSEYANTKFTDPMALNYDVEQHPLQGIVDYADAAAGNNQQLRFFLDGIICALEDIDRAHHKTKEELVHMRRTMEAVQTENVNLKKHIASEMAVVEEMIRDAVAD